MVAVFSLLLQNFGVNGFTEAVIQQESISHQQISNLFWVNIGFSSILTITFILSAPLMVYFYHEPELKIITVVMAFSIIFAGFSTHHNALLQRNMQFHKTSANQIAAVTSSNLIAVVLAFMGWGYWALIIRRLTLPLMSAIGSWILCPWKPAIPSRSAEIRSMLTFAFHTYGSFSLDYFRKNFDKVLLGWNNGAQSLGEYDRAYHLFVMPMNQLTVPIGNVALSALSKIRNKPERFIRYYLKSMSLILFIGMAISVVFLMTGKDLILLLLGPQWVTSGEIFTIFSPAIGMMLVYQTSGWLHLSLGRADRWLRWNILSSIIVALLLLLGLRFGPIGVAAAFSLSFFLLTGPGIWYAGKPINLSVGAIVAIGWRYFFSAAASALLSWTILYRIETVESIYRNLDTFPRIIAAGTLSLLFYLCLIVMLHRSFSQIMEFWPLVLDMAPTIKFNNKKEE